MTRTEINILQGDTFVVSDRQGDITGSPQWPDGLFHRDTRHLSRWEATLNGRGLTSLAADTPDYDEAVFHLTEPSQTAVTDPTVAITRTRQVADGMRERFTLHNFGTAPAAFQLTVRFDADFADIFEVKEGIGKPGRAYRQHTADGVTLGHRRGGFKRETRIVAPGAFATGESLTFHGSLAPGGRWETTVEVVVGFEADSPVRRQPHQPHMDQSLAGWLTTAPRLDTDHADLARLYRRSLVDLAALRFYPDGRGGHSVPAGGLPWFMALFGRDSLIVSYQSLPFLPELARSTLRALAARQATAEDPRHDAEPGKILHELRYGELAYFDERPQKPYYGTADATSLFLIVLDEYERWTGDAALVHELEANARAALAWLRRFGDGFVSYRTRAPHGGLQNQGWKDSDNAVVHPDGTRASTPRATCELQGYAYDARLRTARLARHVWRDDDLAATLEREAAALRDRFDAAYWLPDRRYYAFALDGSGQPVRTLTSNIGHLLWTGIVPPERAADLAAHLLGDALFSGWGVRTIAAGQPAYNPLEYHNGTVWPHDTALAAAGLARYGHHDEANRLTTALLDAGGRLGHRLPEALSGLSRQGNLDPVVYPSACSPQAWATATPMLLIRTMLALHPNGTTTPHLPPPITHLSLHPH